MLPKFIRRAPARHVMSHLLVPALAAGLSFVPLEGARAQHGGHHGHGGHHEHQARGAKKPPPAKKKAPAKRGSALSPPAAHRAVAGAHAHHAQPGGTPSTAEFQVAHERMMRGMALPYTGDADVDFRIQMIPHHQGAIDMAVVAMRHAKDPWTRQLAEAVIVEQQREIAEMQAWLVRRGAPLPSGGQPGHVLTASSFRSVAEEPGTRSESRGQSWAPGSGVPPQR